MTFKSEDQVSISHSLELILVGEGMKQFTAWLHKLFFQQQILHIIVMTQTKHTICINNRFVAR